MQTKDELFHRNKTIVCSHNHKNANFHPLIQLKLSQTTNSFFHNSIRHTEVSNSEKNCDHLKFTLTVIRIRNIELNTIRFRSNRPTLVTTVNDLWPGDHTRLYQHQTQLRDSETDRYKAAYANIQLINERELLQIR